MKTTEKLAIYRERLRSWLRFPMRSEKDKPKPEGFGLEAGPDLFMANMIHDQVMKEHAAAQKAAKR